MRIELLVLVAGALCACPGPSGDQLPCEVAALVSATSASSAKQYAAAEPLLINGYTGMKAREKSISPTARKRIPEAIDRLIALYTAVNKPDELKKWRAERAKYPDPSPVPLAKPKTN